MKILIILPLIIINIHADAAFEKLRKGYLGSKVEIKTMIDSKLNESDHLFNKSSNPLYLSFSANQLSNDLETSNAYQGRGLKQNYYTLSLFKSTFGYGDFRFTHMHFDSDYTKFNLNQTNIDHLYEEKNSLSYTFDFLDRSKAHNLDVYNSQANANKIQEEINRNTNDLNFIKSYLKAKFDLYNLRLIREFKNRAYKRLKRIKKTKEDGTSRKVDYIRAKLQYRVQSRKELSALNTFNASLLKIETLIGVKIPKSLLDSITWTFTPKSFYTNANVTGVIKDIDFLNASLQTLEASNKAALDTNGHKLELGLKYESNIVAEDSSDMLSDSFNAAQGQNREVTLTYTIGLGLDFMKSKNSLAALKMKQLEMSKALKYDEIQTSLRDINNNLDLSQQFIKNLVEEKALAFLSLAEMNKLYERGRASYDDVITSEETLLSVKHERIKYLLEFESNLAHFYLINGTIREFMMSYRD